MRQLEVRMLGGFEVFVDSRRVPAEAWVQRRATDLVKLLALASGHRLSRGEVLEMLWPKLSTDAAASNLHKAASYTRRALGDRGAIVLRSGVVELAPAAEVTTDVERFERGDVDAYRGDLLPDEPYAEWALGARAHLRERRLAVMRSQGRWEEVLREDPADEEAHRALMRRCAASGDRPGAARQFRLLREELSRLGVEPSAETLALQRELTRGPAVRATRLLHAPVEGRERELALAFGALQRASAFDGGGLLITGSVGIGKTRLLEAVLAEAERLGFHTLRGAGEEVEGRTPYAPLTEALDPLAGRRPELIGALADRARVALSRLLPSVRRPEGAPAEEVDRRLVFRAVAELLGQAAAERGVVLAIDDLNNADEATVALVHHLARSGAGARMLVVAAMCDEPLPRAAALVRSRLLGRGAAVELALGPLDRSALAAVAQRAAGRPLPPGTLDAVARSAAGNPFFAEELAASVDASGEVMVSTRLREVIGQRLERLELFGEPLLAALAVIDDGFTEAALIALAGTDRVEEALGEALAAGVLERTRGRLRFRHALVREQLAAGLPEDALRRAHADAAALLAEESRRRSGSPITFSAPVARWRLSRCSPRRPRGPWAWARTATVRRGPSWRWSTRPITSVRACSRCARSSSTVPASPTLQLPMPRQSRSRPRSWRPRCVCSTRVRAWRRATSPAPRPRSSSSRPGGRRTSVSRSLFAAWSRGIRAIGRARAGWQRRRTPLRPIRVTSPSSTACSPTSRVAGSSSRAASSRRFGTHRGLPVVSSTPICA